MTIFLFAGIYLVGIWIIRWRSLRNVSSIILSFFADFFCYFFMLFDWFHFFFQLVFQKHYWIFDLIFISHESMFILSFFRVFCCDLSDFLFKLSFFKEQRIIGFYWMSFVLDVLIVDLMLGLSISLEDFFQYDIFDFLLSWVIILFFIFIFTWFFRKLLLNLLNCVIKIFFEVIFKTCSQK